jgi:hypothetical protein
MSGENHLSRFVRRAETALRGRVRSIAFTSLFSSFLLYPGSQTASASVSFSAPVSYPVGTRPVAKEKNSRTI